MKLVKMSLAAAVLLGASAFALDNVKVSGDAKLFYNTTDAGNTDLFDHGTNSQGDAAIRLGVTADLAKGISAGATTYVVSTLGLENNLVGNTWTGAHENGLDDSYWMGELWAAATVGKTTAKIGRMELDTPLAFSEKWSIVPNTFDGAVILNQDLPDTTLVAAWVGKGNGQNVLGVNALVPALDNTPATGADGIVGQDAKFGNFVSSGAYAFAAVNNSFKPLTAQLWLYNVLDVADAYWLQADVNCQLVKGLTIGAQYTSIDTKGLAASFDDSAAYAVKLGYTVSDALKVSAAYSDVDEDGALKIANVATNNLGAAQSKLYTESWWTYGAVGAPGATSMNVTAEYDAGVAKLGGYYTDVANDAGDMSELALTASKSFGPLDTTLAYISTDVEGADTATAVQVYLTLNF